MGVVIEPVAIGKSRMRIIKEYRLGPSVIEAGVTRVGAKTIITVTLSRVERRFGRLHMDR